MPRYTTRCTWSSGRTCASTRDARRRLTQGGYFSRFSAAPYNENFNDVLRRMTHLYEYGQGASNTPQSRPDTRAPPKPDPTDVEVLGVESVDFNIAQNTRAHRTDEYDITDPDIVAKPFLVIRRGQPFELSVTFNRPYDKTKDELRLVFQVGDKPMPSRGTHIEIILSDKDEPKHWGAKIKSQDGNTLNLTVYTPPTCYVAKWEFKLDVLKKKGDKKVIFRYNHEDKIYMLFNPWCKDDTVYMEGETEKGEYVLNESGRIYNGAAGNISFKPWNFGQFQGNVLDCCMYLLDESRLSWAARGNPIPIIRHITAAVNAPDDYGVLVGNWSGDYAGGTSPLKWTGSVAILEQYYKTKEPVNFGQCWVFSGVTTTVCRALGIPARSVTNFASAHDTDGSITIDIHFDEVGEADDNLNSDSVWNFHVWNETWMSRPDLPSGYGGWQACDATPQEASDGIYCCGPVSILAIKRGEVNLPYDGQFIFAEVNADKVFWTVHPDGSCEKVYVQRKGVGKNISTKPLGSNPDREDVTRLYKFKEGTDEERVAVLKANQAGSCRDDIYERGEEDVCFELVHDENKFVGENFNLSLRITNNAKSERTVTGRESGRTMYYTGVPADPVSYKEFDVTLKPGESKSSTLTVQADDYQPKLKDMCMLQLTAMARVKETKQVFTNMLEFRLRKPHLQIKAPKDGQVGKAFSIDISFTNPLNETLSGCNIHVDGPGLTAPIEINQGNVNPKQTFMTTVNITPKKRGNREFIIIFSSKQLEDINGTHTISVRPK